MYVKGPGAESCPEPMQLRTAVIARLGYDPFSATASMAIIAELTRVGDTLHGKIVLLNDESSSQGARELNAPHDRCSDLVRAMALSISIAIDPEAALARRESPTSANPQSNTELLLPDSEPAQGRPEEPKLAPALPQQPRQARSIRYFTGLGTHMTFGQAPATGYGADILIGGRVRHFSLSFEGRADAESMKQLDSPFRGEIGAWFLLASVVPCLHFGPTAICGVASAGTVRASSEQVSHPSSAATGYGALGGRLALEFPLAGAWTLRLHADAVAPVRGQTIQINDNDVWTFPRLAGLVGAALVVHY